MPVRTALNRALPRGLLANEDGGETGAMGLHGQGGSRVNDWKDGGNRGLQLLVLILQE